MKLRGARKAAQIDNRNQGSQQVSRYVGHRLAIRRYPGSLTTILN
jgi:hypothetical protein